MVKCYVRLRASWQQYVNGMEHIGATSRLGYSRTYTGQGAGFGIGAAYQDCIDLFSTSGAVRTPTPFVATTLFRTDTSLVTDRRVRTLCRPPA